MEDRDPAIVYSDLCRTVSAEGISVDVEIYRRLNDSKWALEVVNEIGSSTVWDNLFDSPQDALDAFEQVLDEEGIETFLEGGDAETLH